MPNEWVRVSEKDLSDLSALYSTYRLTVNSVVETINKNGDNHVSVGTILNLPPKDMVKVLENHFVTGATDLRTINGWEPFANQGLNLTSRDFWGWHSTVKNWDGFGVAKQEGVAAKLDQTVADTNMLHKAYEKARQIVDDKTFWIFQKRCLLPWIGRGIAQDPKTDFIPLYTAAAASCPYSHKSRILGCLPLLLCVYSIWFAKKGLNGYVIGYAKATGRVILRITK